MNKKEFKAEIDKLKKENERILKVSEEQIEKTINENDERTKAMTEHFKAQMTQANERIVALQTKKEMMILTVNITGVQDIGKTLDDAGYLLTARLDDLGMKDKYQILVVPSTMQIGIVR